MRLCDECEEHTATETIPWLKGEKFCHACADEIRCDNAAAADFERMAYGGTPAELAQEEYDNMYPHLPDPWWEFR